jgi:hypothetical protein
VNDDDETGNVNENDENDNDEIENVNDYDREIVNACVVNYCDHEIGHVLPDIRGGAYRRYIFCVLLDIDLKSK